MTELQKCITLFMFVFFSLVKNDVQFFFIFLNAQRNDRNLLVRVNNQENILHHRGKHFILSACRSLSLECLSCNKCCRDSKTDTHTHKYIIDSMQICQFFQHMIKALIVNIPTIPSSSIRFLFSRSFEFSHRLFPWKFKRCEWSVKYITQNLYRNVWCVFVRFTQWKAKTLQRKYTRKREKKKKK